MAHECLSPYRINDQREFFAVSVGVAVKAIVECFIGVHPPIPELDSEEVEVVGKRALYVPPEPAPEITEEGRARNLETLKGLRALLNEEAVS